MKTDVKALVLGLAGLLSGGGCYCQADLETDQTNPPAHTNLIIRGDTPVPEPIPVPPSATVQRSNDGPNLILQGPPPAKGSAPVIPPWMQTNGSMQETPAERAEEIQPGPAQPGPAPSSPADTSPPPDTGGGSGALEGTQGPGVPPPPPGTPMGNQPGITNQPPAGGYGNYYDHSNHNWQNGYTNHDYYDHSNHNWQNGYTNHDYYDHSNHNGGEQNGGRPDGH